MREFPSASEVLRVFEKNPGTQFRLRELVVALGLRSSQARELKHVLKRLSQERKIIYMKKNRFALSRQGHPGPGERYHSREKKGEAGLHPAGPSSRETARKTGSHQNLVTGKLIGHRDGYGFVVPEVPLAGTELDIFISPDGMGSAMHGDRVQVRVTRLNRRGRLEGHVLRVLERAQRTVVGEFHSGERFNYVTPIDYRLPMPIVIPRGQEWPEEEGEVVRRNRQFGGESEAGNAKRRARSAIRRETHPLEDQIVDVEITAFSEPGRSSNPRGRVVEVLGRRDEFGVDVEIVIRKYHLPHRFPPQALAQASKAPQLVSDRDREGRRDFRHLPIVTIDGEKAKDFDDAVYVERLPSGNYLLQVHIADVAYYVRPGTELDREARLRGTSVYFPDRAVPMLPLELSNGICSLNPHVDRLTMSALIEIDSQGRTVKCELLPGVIRSTERMTYTAVRDILAGDPTVCQRYQSLIENFRLMQELATVLNERRERRGSIDFDLPEPEIEFDENGRMIGVTRSERNIAHRIIEEFMLAANEAVADFLERKGIPTLFRIHEKPDPKKVLEFEEIAATFGYSLGIDLPSVPRMRVRGRDERQRYPRFHERIDTADLKITSRQYQHLTERIAGKPEERILSYLMLRSLKQARYSEENVGHFALASPTYTHFTSPIRRYPDLVVHRILKAALRVEGGTGQLKAAVKKPTARKPKASREDSRTFLLSSTQRLDRHSNAGPALEGGAFVESEDLHVLGLETSESERRAADAERELMEWKKVSFMARHVGDEFEALVISLIKQGFFVELTDLFVEGFVSIASLDDDYYIYRERMRAIIGQRSRRAYYMGDRVRVRLDRIDRSGSKLEFSLVTR